MANNIDIIQLTKYDGTPFYPLVDINSVAGLSTRLNTIGNNITSLQNGLTTLQGRFDANGKINYANLPNLYIGNARVMSSAQTAQGIGGLGTLLPGANAAYDLGSSTLKWRDAYFGGTSYVGDELYVTHGSYLQYVETNVLYDCGGIYTESTLGVDGDTYLHSGLYIGSNESITIYSQLDEQDNEDLLIDNAHSVFFDGASLRNCSWYGATIDCARGGTGLTNFGESYRLLYSQNSLYLSTLAPNKTTTRKFLQMTGTGSAGSAPVWDTVSQQDVLGTSDVGSTSLPVYYKGASNYALAPITDLDLLSQAANHGYVKAKRFYLSSDVYFEWIAPTSTTDGYVKLNAPLLTTGDQIVGSGTPGGGGGGGSTPYLTDLLDVIQGIQPSANKMLIWTSQGTNNAGTTGGWTLIDKSSVGVSTDATQSAHGLMSTADKIKLDSIQFGTQVSDYIPITIGSTTKNVLTAHQSLAAYATQTWVNQQIDALPEPMVFKGSLGTGGTVTTLPAASSSNEGHTYKVITAGTYQSITAKVGDTFISTGSEWVLIPSGDEPEGTVTSVGLTVPTGLSVSGSPITTSGTFAITFASGYSIPTTANQTAWSNKYAKPSTGIPLTDLASGVQTSLGLADTAYQKPSTGIPATDLASAVQTNITNGATAYGYFSSGILPVSHGGTGKDTLTSGSALIGNGTSAVTLRAITNNTVATAVTASTNLITANTLYYHKGNSNIVTVGTITSGTWHGSTIDNDYITNHTITVGSTVFNLGDTKTSLAGLVNVTMTGTLKVGDAEITWDGTNGYLKINKPLLTIGDQIVGSGTPGGGGGGGSTPYLTDLLDVIAGITPTADKMLIWSASGTNNAGTTGGWTLIDKSSVGVTTNASQSAAGLMSSADKAKLDAIEAQANKYVLPTASASVLGGIKIGSGLSINASTGVLDATYTYTLPLAANGTRGGIQIGYSSSGKNYAVQLSSEKAYVNVPWTDTTYKLTLNGTVKGTTGGTDLGSFYAPTGGGTANQVLIAGGSNTAPSWTNQSNLSVGTASKLGTATIGSSTMPIYLNAGTPTAIASFKEAYLSWGGKNFNNGYSPIDGAMVDELGACRTMFLRAKDGNNNPGIIIEYSRDAGETWTDYGATDAEKVGLFSSGASFIVGKATKEISSANNMLRVTMKFPAAGLYTYLNKFVIFITTNGSTGCWCTIRGRFQTDVESNIDTWTIIADTVGIGGWSGYNVINTSSFATYSNTKSTQYGEVQFIFGCTGHSSSNYAGLVVTKIFGFGGVGYATPSTMAKTGHLYSFDSSQNATFPAGVYTNVDGSYLGSSTKRWYLYATNGVFSGNVSIGGTLGVTGNTTLSGTLTVGTASANKATTLNGTLSASGNTTVGGTLTVGTSSVNKATTLNGTLGVTGATTLSSTLAVTGLATLSGGATIPSGKTLVIGGATISWEENSGNGYLKIDKPLLTTGDQIVGSGTPSGGGGGGSTPYLTDLLDVISGIDPSVDKMLIWTPNGTNNAGTTGGWTLIDKSSVGVTTVASASADGLMSSSDWSKLNGIEAGANNYVHPTGGANVTISAANGKVLSAITVNNLGHVTSVSSKTLAAADIPSITKSKISDFPTTWALANITGADDLKAIEALTGTSGFLKKTAANTWTLDTSTYLTSHQTITLASGTNNGTLKITTAAGTTDNIAVKGLQALAYKASIAFSDLSTHPTTISGYGITDAYTKTEVNTAISNAITAALYFRGESSTEITNGGTETATINGSPWTAHTGDVVLFSGFEFAWDGTKWIKFGDETSYVLKTTTVNGHALSGDVTVTKSDIGLGDVENTKLSTWTGTSNITTVGTITIGTWGASTIGVDKGGTGKTSWTQYGVLYASGTTTLAQVTNNTTSTKKFLRMTGTGSAAATPAWDTLVASDIPNLDWSKITSGKPTTLSGYGITDAQALDDDLTKIAALSSSGYLKRSVSGSTVTWSLNTISLSNGTITIESSTITPVTSVAVGGTGHTSELAVTAGTSTSYITVPFATSATNATNATTASKLSTVSKTAWGQTFWTSGGIPATISGNMSSVGKMTFTAQTTKSTSGNVLEVVTIDGITYLHTTLPFLSDGDQIVGSGSTSGGGGGGASYLSDLLDLSNTITDKPDGGGYGLVYSTSATDKNGSSGAWIYVAPGTTANISGANTTARLWSGNTIKSAIEAYGYVTSSGVVSVATGIGLTGGTITNTGTLKVKLKNETLNTADSTKSTSTSGGLYSIEADKSGNLAVRVPWVNTWNAASTSQAGYVPKLALASTATIATQSTEYVLTYISGTETAPVWRKLPANAFNNNTYTNGTGISLSGNTFSLNVAGAKTALGLGTMAYETASDYLTTTTAASTYVKLSPGTSEQTISSSISSFVKGVINLWRSSGDHYTFLGFSNGTTETYLGGIGFKSQSDHNLYHKDGSSYYTIFDENNYTSYVNTTNFPGLNKTGTVTSVKVGSTSYSPSSGVVSLPAYPTTLPASDVSAWAKAATKPSYTLDEVSDGSTRKLANYVLKAGDTMSGSLAICLTPNSSYPVDRTKATLIVEDDSTAATGEIQGGNIIISRGYSATANQSAGAISFYGRRLSGGYRNGARIASVSSVVGNTYDRQDLVFYASNNTNDSSVDFEEAMRIRADKAVSMSGWLSVSRGGVYNIYTNNTASDGTATGIRFQLNGTTKGGLFVSSDENLYYSVGTASTGNKVLTSANYDSFALPLSAGSSYPLTGHLYLNEGLGIQAVGGPGLLVYHPTSGWSGIDSTQWGLGSINSQGVIRSNSNDLLHYKGGSSYSIWDASNSGISTKPWACSTLSVNTSLTLPNDVSILGTLTDSTTASMIKMSTSNNVVIGNYSFAHNVNLYGTLIKFYAAGTTAIGTVSSTGLDVTGTVTASGIGTFDRVVLSNSGAVSHIEFTRAGWNYVSVPTDGVIAFNTGGSGSANTSMAVTPEGIRPGAKDSHSCGLPSVYWGSIYGKDLYLGGDTHNTAAGSIIFSEKLDSQRNGFKIAPVHATSANRVNLVFYRSNNGNSPWAANWTTFMTLSYDGKVTIAGSLTTSGDQVISSDATLKTNWKELNYTVKDIANVKIGIFDWKDGHGTSAGSVAQDWKKLIPELVHGEEGHMTLAYGQIAMLNSILIARSVVKHEDEITVLRRRVAELEKEVEQLKMN